MTTDDAPAAAERLRARDRLAADSAFVVGHGLGAYWRRVSPPATGVSP